MGAGGEGVVVVIIVVLVLIFFFEKHIEKYISIIQDHRVTVYRLLHVLLFFLCIIKSPYVRCYD